MLERLQHGHPIDEISFGGARRRKSSNARRKFREVVLDDKVAKYSLGNRPLQRGYTDIALGGSPRHRIALSARRRALAAMHGRDFILPDDVQAAVVCPNFLDAMHHSQGREPTLPG